MSRIEELVENTIEDFCLEFLKFPYLCYTEHGLHAMFYAKLLDNMPVNRRIIRVGDKDICIVQKEYSMAHRQGESKRAHWDIAILEDTQASDKGNWYDFLKLNSVVEFGLNESIDHLERDVKRLSHQESGVKHGFVVHLHRYSRAVTRRDWVRKHGRTKMQIEVQDEIQSILRDVGGDVIAYFALVDSVTGTKVGPLRMDRTSEPLLVKAR